MRGWSWGQRPHPWGSRWAGTGKRRAVPTWSGGAGNWLGYPSGEASLGKAIFITLRAEATSLSPSVALYSRHPGACRPSQPLWRRGEGEREGQQVASPAPSPLPSGSAQEEERGLGSLRGFVEALLVFLHPPATPRGRGEES